MKTTTILFALCFSSLLLTGFAQGEEEADAAAAASSVLSFMDNDSANATNLPVKVVNGTTSQSINNYTGDLNVTTNQTYAFTWTNGVPLSSIYNYESTETTSDTDYVILALAVGSRVLEVEVDGETATFGDNLGPGATFNSSNECGDYSMNGATGVLTVFLDNDCTVELNQTDAVTGAVQYSSNSLTPTQLAAVCTAITKAANASVDCEITGTASGSTIVYFALTVPSGTSATALANIANNVNSAIVAKTLTVDGTTQLAGYAVPAAASAAAGTTAPSVAANAAIAAANKSHSRMVVVAGVFSTVLAAFFGLAL